LPQEGQSTEHDWDVSPASQTPLPHVQSLEQVCSVSLFSQIPSPHFLQSTAHDFALSEGPQMPLPHVSGQSLGHEFVFSDG